MVKVISGALSGNSLIEHLKFVSTMPTCFICSTLKEVTLKMPEMTRMFIANV